MSTLVPFVDGNGHTYFNKDTTSNSAIPYMGSFLLSYYNICIIYHIVFCHNNLYQLFLNKFQVYTILLLTPGCTIFYKNTHLYDGQSSLLIDSLGSIMEKIHEPICEAFLKNLAKEENVI